MQHGTDVTQKMSWGGFQTPATLPHRVLADLGIGLKAVEKRKPLLWRESNPDSSVIIK